MTNPLAPPQATASKLSGWDQFKLWFAANRTVIGSIISGISVILLMNFEDMDKLAGVLASIAMLVAGSYTTGAGMHKSDDHWKEKKLEATLPPEQRRPRRRKSDA